MFKSVIYQPLYWRIYHTLNLQYFSPYGGEHIAGLKFEFKLSGLKNLQYVFHPSRGHNASFGKVKESLSSPLRLENILRFFKLISVKCLCWITL